MGSSMLMQGQSKFYAVSRLQSKMRMKALFLASLMILTSLAALEFAAWEASASTDQDGDGLTCGMEFLLQTQCQDWDSDNDGLPDGWEWQYGLDPNDGSSLGSNGASGDPDGDSMSNLQEYTYLTPVGWDSSNTPNALDNGVWWNGTVPVRNWNEEGAMQVNQPACGAAGNDGNGSTVILCDEDPVGDICNDGIDNDKDGLVDQADPDKDGDQVCGSNDDDGDGLSDEDPDGWDTDGDGLPDGWEVANGLNATNPTGIDGMMGDPDGDGLVNIQEYVNPSWTTTNGGTPYFMSGNPQTEQATENVNPCNPLFGCLSQTASVDQDTDTDPWDNDTDNDGLEDGWEALTILTDPTSADTDSDGIEDGIEANVSTYGDPPQHSDPRNNNTDGDQFDDGDEDKNGNGRVDSNETDPTRREDAGDFDNDGIDNWIENLSCTMWNVYDTDFGGVGDGDESNLSHSTDPCMSMIDYSTTLDTAAQAGGYSASLQRLYLTDASGFDSTPIDWRTLNGATGYYNDSSGVLTSFSYGAVVNNVLFGVVTPPPANTVEVISKNGSWCHYEGSNSGSLGTTHSHCDDDYEDSDGDGLADWEETLSIWGWFSISTVYDSDGDGQNDLDEILNSTDPMEPCDNTLDTDGDLLNDYFENTTGCDLMFVPGMGAGNGSTDAYVTDYLDVDTDNGGVIDSQEYLDGTNPQNDPSDDMNPADTDGDGIPDNIENQTGTDWRNPDTDGGGMSDYEECPPQFWQDCHLSPQNPWDPTDDINPNEIAFYANNTTSTGAGVDTDSIHRWRVKTYDFYTGGAYGINTSLVSEQQLSAGDINTYQVANNTFWNSTEMWLLEFLQPIEPGGTLPQPSHTIEYMSWFDSMAELNQTNHTRDIRVSATAVGGMMVSAPEVFYTDAELQSGVEFPSPYATDLPAYFTDYSSLESNVTNITYGVITDSGAVSAWDRVQAIKNYLSEEDTNVTDPDFKLNFDGSGAPNVEDVTRFILDHAREGSCSEYVTIFTTMARIAGIPARTVTGYTGGVWHGTGYMVMGSNWNTWSEVHLQQSGTNLDMGWIPIDPCPPAEDVQFTNESVNPLTLERDLSSGLIYINGSLQFTNNSTGAVDALVNAYLVSANDTTPMNPSILNEDSRIRAILTDQNGNFSINGTPAMMPSPGYAKVVVESRQGGYVPYSYQVYAVTLNITDDVNFTLTGPEPLGAPIVGAGTTTTITGNMLWNAQPQTDPSLKGNFTVELTYPSSVLSANVTLQAPVWTDGFFSFDVNLSDLETQGLRQATISFAGWHEANLNLGSTPIYHARPGSMNFTMNVSAAPNMTATIEGPGGNHSLLVINENLYVNGTVVTRGASPAPMDGYISLLLRSNGSNTSYSNITTWAVTNGVYNITWNLNGSDVPVGPGYLDVQLLFGQGIPGASDQDEFTGYGLRSEVTMSFGLGSIGRGEMISVMISLADHTGSANLPFNGTYLMTFDGTLVNTSVDPVGDWITSEFTPSGTLAAGDYWWNISYDGYLGGNAGSEWFKPSNASGLLLVTGTATLSINLAQEWTHLGGTTVISGTVTDDVLGTPILWNTSDVRFSIALPGTGPSGPNGEPPLPMFIPLGNALSNQTNGNYAVVVTLPSDLASAAHNLTAVLDFDTFATNPIGAYYWMDTSPAALIGLESELVLESNITSVIVEAGNSIPFNITVTDVGDGSPVVGETVNFTWDWGGTNTSIGQVVSGADGVAILNWVVPPTMDPGYYDVRIWMANDTSDPLTAGSTRWWGNETFMNVTVQVPSDVVISSVPLNVTAGTSFQLVGTVNDGNDVSRPFNGPVGIEVFFLGDPSETLVASHITANNGSFNLSVPTDPNNDGITNGNKTLVVSVLDGSNPFYLTGSASSGMLIIGVTDFEQQTPLIPVVVTRGENISFGAVLVEASDNFRLITNTTVAAQFHDTWMPESMTDSNATASWTYSVPNTQPLGQITVTIYYNATGIWEMHPTTHQISTISVRSITVLVVDNISANPLSGSSFDVTGSLVSDNGSGIIARDGAGLLPQVQVSIDGFTNNFQVSNAIAQPNGTWTAVITLDSDFPRGSHLLAASYTPTVNYYLGSSGNNTFDSRGYSVISILTPENLDPDYRTVRGDNVSVQVMLQDNTLAVISNATITIEFPTLNISTTVVTDINGTAWALLNVPDNIAPGPLSINASYLGMPGTTGVIGDEDTIMVIILAPTVITIDSVEGNFIAGDIIWVNGTLLDEHGNLLQTGGVPAASILHLSVDGNDTGAFIESNASTGTYSLMYTMPSETAAGSHLVTIFFKGGFMWVDPIGQGDSTNPEYYLNSSAEQWVNISVPTYIVLLGGGGDVDREGLLIIDGTLFDIVDNRLANETLEVWFDNAWLTNVTTDSEGNFQVYYPVPADSPLGPQMMEMRFTGSTFYLPSEANTSWNVYSAVNVDMVLPSEIAINDNITIQGTVRDNLPEGWLLNHSLEVRFNGTLLGTVYSDSDGVWTIEWTIPNNIGLGSHPVEIYAPAQGWYREASANGTIWVAHHSDLLLTSEDNGDATRGTFWNVSGRLYDSDAIGLPGIAGRSVDILLDGVFVDTVTTDSFGEFELLIPVSMVSARGEHTLSAHYAGEASWLATNSTTTLTTWSDIDWQLVENENIIVRSSSSHPIIIEGRILEVGGSGNPVEMLDLILYWNQSDLGISEQVVWMSDGSFSIQLTAPQYMSAGDITLTLRAMDNTSRNYNGGQINTSIFVVIPVDFETGVEVVPYNGDRVIAWVKGTAKDTQLPAGDILVTAVLYNDSYGLSRTLTGRTADNGSFWFEFVSVPPMAPYGDGSTYGSLYVQINSTDEKVAEDDRERLETTMEVIVLSAATIEEGISNWLYGGLIAAVLGSIAFVVYWRRRKQSALSELADVFAYTAELLAAGDETREAIFNCYESLCAILMRHRFLRRDFETVREFEMAIRKALPINEEALVALDSVFEEARYSRHEMGEAHKTQAQDALGRVLGQIDELAEVPLR
uniref:Transglutaminase domain-containing protein n=1 Tax=uncultured marine group II/III euryarchaeote KM3_34_C09 TaxID=1456437 RepID=A0A075GZ40_9EURY|nr:transglutaminase domain-containing protein [uncultured marine group II/III euryarchaeote KM3_34_C09]